MKLFGDFIRSFKVKYRVQYDRSIGKPSSVLIAAEDGEVALYERYLRRMRQTGETNLSLDMLNLSAYPPSKKLFSQLQKYPQEIIPAMDQTLKDVMLELAEQDQQAGMVGMTGNEGNQEIADIIGKVYKVRPFNLEAGNMRELNPSGTLYHGVSVCPAHHDQIRTSSYASKVWSSVQLLLSRT